MKNILNIYHKYLKIKKQKYFFHFLTKTLKKSNYINKYNSSKENIHNRLFNDSTKREILLRELSQKINLNEEEKCTFTPKINNNSMKYNKTFFDKINKITKRKPFSNEQISNYSSFNIKKKKLLKIIIP